MMMRSCTRDKLLRKAAPTSEKKKILRAVRRIFFAFSQRESGGEQASYLHGVRGDVHAAMRL